MDWDKLIQRLVFVIPAIHVASCGMYIVGYSVGFGDQVASLFSVSDFVTITFNNLVILYTGSILVPVLFILARHRSGTPYADDLVTSTTSPKDALAIQSMNKMMRAISKGALVIIFVTSTVNIAAIIFLDAFPRYQISLVLLALSFTALFYSEADRHNFRGIRAELAWVGFIFFVAIFGFALDQGIRDRRLDFRDLGDSYYFCKNKKVLSPIGSYYIAADESGERSIINDKCDTVFAFKKKRPPFKGSLFSAIQYRLKD